MQEHASTETQPANRRIVPVVVLAATVVLLGIGIFVRVFHKPRDVAAQDYRASSQNPPDQIAAAAQFTESHPTPENYLNLSLLYHRAGRYQDSIAAAQKALRLKPDYAAAYNNIAAAYEDLHQWDQAIAAAQQALRLQPDYQLARNNLAYAQAQKKISKGR